MICAHSAAVYADFVRLFATSVCSLNVRSRTRNNNVFFRDNGSCITLYTKYRGVYVHGYLLYGNKLYGFIRRVRSAPCSLLRELCAAAIVVIITSRVIPACRFALHYPSVHGANRHPPSPNSFRFSKRLREFLSVFPLTATRRATKGFSTTTVRCARPCPAHVISRKPLLCVPFRRRTRPKTEIANGNVPLRLLPRTTIDPDEWTRNSTRVIIIICANDRAAHFIK